MPETKKSSRGRRYLIGFSVIGSILVILLFAFINFTTGKDFMWFVFPSYAVLWWPLITIFAGKRSMKILSVVGSLLTIAVMFIMNYLLSWDYRWFILPSFALLWWPLIAFTGRRSMKVLSVVGSLLAIVTLIIANYLTAWFIPGFTFPWAVVPALMILWWPLIVFLGANHAKALSIIGSVLIIITLAITNLIASPSDIWFHYSVFAVIWWPLTVFFANPRTIKGYSIAVAAIIIVFITLINCLATPSCLWAPLTYLPILMWPAWVLFGKRLGKLNIALYGCLAGILYYTAMNIWVLPGFPWAFFPAYALLWWPLAVAFAKREHPLLFSVAGTLLTAVFFIMVNIIASAQTVWAVYPIFAIIWWPLSVYYFQYRRRKINETSSLSSNDGINKR